MTDEEDRSRPSNADIESKEDPLATGAQSRDTAPEVRIGSPLTNETRQGDGENVISIGIGSRPRNEPDKNRDAAAGPASGKNRGDGGGGDGGQAASGQPNPPKGWRFVDAADLAQLGDADAVDLRSYFRRGAVNLKIAGHPAIKPLSAEGGPISPKRIHEELGRRTADDVKPVVIWLGGVCGSGKSTAFYVVLRRFLECGGKNHCVLIRNNNEASWNISTDFAAEVLSACMENDNKRYVVAFDNAGPDLGTIFELVKLLRDRRRHDIDVVFACDETDWRRYQTKDQDAKARSRRWEEVAALEHLQFRYVNRDDIVQIMEALFVAELCSHDERKQRLRKLELALLNGNDRGSVTGFGYSGFPRRPPVRMSNANKSETVFDGPLLGASLEDSGTRECARKCVEKFLERLRAQDDQEKTGYTTAVRMVAVAEAAGIDFLSEAVLLRALADNNHINTKENIENLKYEVIFIDELNGYLKTRHLNISEAIIEDDYSFLCNLLLAAAGLFRQKIVQQEYWRKWCDIGIAGLVKNIPNALAISTLKQLTDVLPTCWRAWCVWAELRLRQEPHLGLNILPKSIFNPSAGFEAVKLLAKLCQELSAQGYSYEGLELYFSMRALADLNSVSGAEIGRDITINAELAKQLFIRIETIYPRLLPQTKNIDMVIGRYISLCSGGQNAIFDQTNCESVLRGLALIPTLTRSIPSGIFNLINSACLPPNNWTYYGLRALGLGNPAIGPDRRGR